MQPWIRDERVVTPGVYKNATKINIDIGYKSREGNEVKENDVVTTT